jgi:hypothetical protein
MTMNEEITLYFAIKPILLAPPAPENPTPVEARRIG